MPSSLQIFSQLSFIAYDHMWTLPAVWLKSAHPVLKNSIRIFFFLLEARAQTKVQSIAQGASREIRTEPLSAWQGLPDTSTGDQQKSILSLWVQCILHNALILKEANCCPCIEHFLYAGTVLSALNPPRKLLLSPFYG